jgi:hypothetical protein
VHVKRCETLKEKSSIEDDACPSMCIDTHNMLWRFAMFFSCLRIFSGKTPSAV